MPDTIAPPETALPLIQGAQSWYGPDQAKLAAEWSYDLTPADVTEIEAALAKVRQTEILAIGPAEFPVPGLAARLARIKQEILHGRGFFVIRGLPI